MTLRPLFLAASLACTASGACAEPVWTRMTYVDIRRDPALDQIWRRQQVEVDGAFLAAAGADSMRKMGGHAPFSAVVARFERPGRVVIVSIASGAGICDDGPNSASSTQIHSVCPMKVSVVRGGTTRSLLVPRACYLEIVHDAMPGGPAIADNGDFAHLDPSSSKLSVETIRDGRPLSECSRTVDVDRL